MCSGFGCSEVCTQYTLTRSIFNRIFYTLVVIHFTNLFVVCLRTPLFFLFLYATHSFSVVFVFNFLSFLFFLAIYKTMRSAIKLYKSQLLFTCRSVYVWFIRCASCFFFLLSVVLVFLWFYFLFSSYVLIFIVFALKKFDRYKN